MKEIACNNYFAEIFIAGGKNNIENILKKYCWENNLCVTIEKNKFVYKGGCESGVRIGIRNYPRFVSSEKSIINSAKNLTIFLINETNETSAMIQTNKDIIWIHRRENDGKKFEE